ncbi:GntR family transcriptional regulator [soil metagenome]
MSIPSSAGHESPSHVERVRIALIEAIESGELTPGMRVDEREIGERFGISRTPVREAMLMLAVQGLVQIAPRSGIFVALPEPAEIVAILEATAEQEAVICRLAVERMTDRQRRRLRDLADASERAAQRGHGSAYKRANVEFHELLYEACGNAHVIGPLRLLRLRLAVFRKEMFDQPARLRAAAADNQRIVAAALAEDADAAALAMREHVLAKGTAVNQIMLKLRDFANANGADFTPTPGSRAATTTRRSRPRSA